MKSVSSLVLKKATAIVFSYEKAPSKNRFSPIMNHYRVICRDESSADLIFSTFAKLMQVKESPFGFSGTVQPFQKKRFFNLGFWCFQLRKTVFFSALFPFNVESRRWPFLTFLVRWGRWKFLSKSAWVYLKYFTFFEKCFRIKPQTAVPKYRRYLCPYVSYRLVSVTDFVVLKYLFVLDK